MAATASSPRPAATLVGAIARRVLRWWHVTHFGAQLLALALSPSSYGRDHRPALARHIYLDTAPNLAWFTVLSALLSVVLIRIVVVTALSYGLSQFAVQMVVRVLVLELIPTTAALFVALRCTIPRGVELAALRRGLFDGRPGAAADPLRDEVLPRVVGGVFAVWTLVAVNCVVALTVAYLVVYGFAIGGFAAYTRTVGQVFSPDVTLIFVLKTLFLSFAVAVIPMASAWSGPRSIRAATGHELRVLIRLFVVILLIEVVSLVGNYY
jgi:phospholipid/cholesterol/gamma-HCH transport system permease protein